MTELERFAALLMSEWQAKSGRTDSALSVGALVDSVLPYKLARRSLQFDSSEDYEMMVLCLVAEEAGIAKTDPAEAGDIARATLAEKIPDLDQLQLLRSASVVFSDDAISRLDGVRPMPPSAAIDEQGSPDGPPTAPTLVTDDSDEDQVIPIRRAADIADATRVASGEPPEEFLTGVNFTPPDGCCWSCNEPLPTGRTVKFCVECGADQRSPLCVECEAPVERHWKHCPDCGSSQARS